MSKCIIETFSRRFKELQWPRPWCPESQGDCPRQEVTPSASCSASWGPSDILFLAGEACLPQPCFLGWMGHREPLTARSVSSCEADCSGTGTPRPNLTQPSQALNKNYMLTTCLSSGNFPQVQVWSERLKLLCQSCRILSQMTLFILRFLTLTQETSPRNLPMLLSLTLSSTPFPGPTHTGQSPDDSHGRWRLQGCALESFLKD